MRLFFTLSALLLCASIYAQEKEIVPRWSIDAGIGTSKLVAKPGNIDQQLSMYSHSGFSRRFALGKKWHYLSTGLSVETDRHFTDGYFVKNGNQYAFIQTPDNYKLNELTIDYISLPLQYQYWQRGGVLSLGPVFSYQLDAKSRFKTGDTKYTQNAPIQNKFQWGAAFEMLSSRRKWNGSNPLPMFGYGIYYQVSKLVTTGKAFHPLTVYVRFGLGLK